jgi:hypothetical protein
MSCRSKVTFLCLLDDEKAVLFALEFSVQHLIYSGFCHVLKFYSVMGAVLIT